MTGVVRLISNPAAPEQQYALWDTGRVDPFGGAIPIPADQLPPWYTLVVPPGVDIHITDWNTASGYLLDFSGGFHAFGGAPSVSITDDPVVMPGVPYFRPSRNYCAFRWNPDGSGQGYVLSIYGEYFHFGGATPCPRAGRVTTEPIIRGFDMQFSPFPRAIMYDFGGVRRRDFPTYFVLPQDGYFDMSRDWVRDMIVTDFGDFAETGNNPSGYLLTADGRVYEWGPNPPQDAFGGPFRGAAGTQVGIALINATNPLTIGTIAKLGQYSTYTASTPPTVIPGGLSNDPPPVVTETTRPKLTWSFTDPELDKQAGWQLVVWTQAWADIHDMTRPFANRTASVYYAEGSERTTRGVTLPIDLDNGGYRYYIRVQDTSDRWSLWANRGWTQNVPVPDAPTNLTATVTGLQINLVVTVAVPALDQFIGVEYTDDGVTWQDVRGAEALTISAKVYAVDYDAPFGVSRTYRARVFFVQPRTRSLPSEEQTVTIERYTFALTSTQDPTLGGEVFPDGSMGWERGNAAGVFEPLGSDFPIVIGDGTSGSQRRTLTLNSDSVADWRIISALAASGHTLVLREPFGEMSYCRVVGSWSRDQVRVLAGPGSGPELAHVHVVSLPLVQVARPLPLALADPEY